jgi:hemerythrin-like domain-containing protein
LLLGVAQAPGRDAWAGWDSAARQTLADFRGLYDEHIRLEEEQVYPAAQAVLTDATLRAMGADMQNRRMAR